VHEIIVVCTQIIILHAFMVSGLVGAHSTI
jgi:hypothetical protein